MKTEKILVTIAVVGLFFKLMHWTGAIALLLLSLVALAMVYFPFGFYFLSGKSFKQQNIGLSLGVGMALALAIIAILFKLMHWPGALFMLLFGIFATAPLWFVVRSAHKKNTLEELDHYYKGLVIRLSVIGAINIVLFLVSLAMARFVIQ